MHASTLRSVLWIGLLSLSAPLGAWAQTGDAPERHGMGEECETNGDCQSGVCTMVVGMRFCSAECSRDPGVCPKNMRCMAQAEGRFCVPWVDEAVMTDACSVCSASAQCSTGFCGTLPGQTPRCTFSCDPDAAEPDCRDGFGCRRTGGPEKGVCWPTTNYCASPYRGAQNQACHVDGSCNTGLSCIEGHCHMDCSPESPACGDFKRTRCLPLKTAGRYACFFIAETGEACVPEVCAENRSCGRVDPKDPWRCFETCKQNSDCPANHRCLDQVCQAAQAFLDPGQICRSDAECTSGLCRIFGAHSYCVTDCKTGQSCPSGFQCDGQYCADPRWIEQKPEDTPQAGYCACDQSGACDTRCDCDPDCKKSKGGCSAQGPGEGGIFGGFLLLLLLGLSRRGRFVKS